MSILLTKRASFYIKEAIKKRGKGLGLRFSIKNAGCSGFKYKLEYVDCPDEDDLVFESCDVKVFISPLHLDFFKNVQLDVVKSGLNEFLEFKNPNIRARCGCGKSFAF